MRRFCFAQLAMFTAVTGSLACSRNKEPMRDAERTRDVPGFESPTGAMTPASRPGEPRAVRPRDPLQVADDDMKQVLEAMNALAIKPIASLTPEQARSQPTPADAVKAVLEQKGKALQPTPMSKIENRKIPGASERIDVRIYTPSTDAERPLPVVVYWHGGGFVIANLDVYDSTPRALADEAEAIVVSADYRRAPEHKFPAAHDDAIAAYQWVAKNAGSFGGDPKRIAVAGESAGGNLAANVAIMARDRGLTTPLHALLVYPVTQPSMDTASYQEWANAKPLDKSAMGYFIEKYTRSPEDAKDPRLNLVAANLKNFPPTTIVLAQIDPLSSDGELLAERLEAAGVKVAVKVYAGVTHEFFGMGAVVADAKDAQEYAASRLEDAFEVQ